MFAGEQPQIRPRAECPPAWVWARLKASTALGIDSASMKACLKLSLSSVKAKFQS